MEPQTLLEEGTRDHRFIYRGMSPITEEEAQHIQTTMGYSPYGYGFYSFRCVEIAEEDQRYYRASWICQSSCD